MSLKSCKVYNDGSHFIAIRHTEGKKGARPPRPPEEEIIVEERDGGEDNSIKCPEITVKESKELKENVLTEDKAERGAVADKVILRKSTRSDEFLYWYRQSVGMECNEQREFIASKLRPYFKSQDGLYLFVDRKLQCRRRADIARRIRCIRRAALHDFNYFCTFTYDGKKMNESAFERKLLNTLRHFASRKGWKYMGTWERGGDTGRLHFHALMNIPPDKMSGSIVTKSDYDVKHKRMVEYTTNTFFEERFGRNTFDIIDGTALPLSTAIGYILKYIEKDGGRIICSRGLRTFIETDIDNDDIIARLREEDDTKYILFDDFMVYREGEELGEFSPGILTNAKTIN